MSGFHDLVQRVTQRLGVDRELRMEVARELEDHLEDSEAEFLRAGESPEQARASAVRALGDEAEIAEGLWEANRGRMKWRAVMFRVLRLTLMPVAVLVMVLLLGRLSSQIVMDYDSYLRDPDRAGWMSSLFYGWSDSGMSEDEHLIVFGDVQAKSKTARERAIWERFPDEPMYYANFACTAFGEANQEVDARVTGETLRQILERGREVEPENALYDYLLAYALLEQGADFTWDKELSFTYPFREGQDHTILATRIEVVNPEAISQAEALILDGSKKPYLRDYAVELEWQRQEFLPDPKTLKGVLWRFSRAPLMMRSIDYLGSHPVNLVRSCLTDAMFGA